jgi:hypothetical protein
MKLYVFEGTAEEFSEVAPTIGFKASETDLIQEDNPEKAEGEKRPVTIDEAREILTRLELSDNIRQLLGILYAAGQKRLTSDELKKSLKLNTHKFRGMLGAFGRRVSYTAPGKIWFLDQEWDFHRDQFTWTLPETVRQAMRELKIGI